MSDVRCLSKPLSPMEVARVNSVPVRVPRSARDDIADFLTSTLLPAVHDTSAGHRMGIEHELQRMSYVERVIIELEMDALRRAVHTSDYDPLK